MKKRISILLVIAILCVTLVASFAGCSKPIDKEEAMTTLKGAIEATKDKSQYLIKSTYIYSLKKTVSNNLNVFPDADGNPKSATITVVTNDNAKTTYKTTYWGDSLNKDVKAKDAKDEDYKKSVAMMSNRDKTFILNEKEYEDGTKITKEEKENAKKLPDFYMTPMTFDQFCLQPDIIRYTKDILMTNLEIALASGQMVPIESDPYTANGVVRNFSYADIGLANAILLNIVPVDENGNAQVEDGKAYSVDANGNKTYYDKFPLSIETTNGKVSKVIGSIQEVGKDYKNSIIKRKYYITMQGPNINIPGWTDNGYKDADGKVYPNYEIKPLVIG